MRVSQVRYAKRFWWMRLNVAVSVSVVTISLGSTLLIGAAG
ncbi:hypothetical protein WEIDD23_01196 [Weissella sp. DD23]|nr:hypothetical protein WEIDD23_01196 [Weissella sp. DD23]